jgi:hypothetical protein
MSLHADYFRMVAEWKEICSSDLSASEKSDGCLKIFSSLIGHLALLSARVPNPTLRFYAYMLMLWSYVAPGPGSDDELGQIAIIPAARLVDSWLRANAVEKRSNPWPISLNGCEQRPAAF